MSRRRSWSLSVGLAVGFGLVSTRPAAAETAKTPETAETAETAVPAQVELGRLSGTTDTDVQEVRRIGTSGEGRAILASRIGTPGGTVVLVVGVIHGDEQQGARITRLLRAEPAPDGVELWIVDSMNPDGVAADRRTNAGDVDLNRNFEIGWGYIAKSASHRQYSGEAPADQPETQAMQGFIREIRPALTIWYHQDLDTISGGGNRPAIAEAYAAATGMAISRVGCSQQCTGTAGAFVRGAVDGAANLLVELPGSDEVTPEMIRTHADAVRLVAGM